MISTAPPVPHLPIPILELICNELAADVSRLGRVLSAMRAEAAPSSKLATIVSTTASTWVTPTFEVVVDCLPVPEPLLYRCKHGLLPRYVAPRLIGPIIREDNGRGTMVWTPEHGKTFFLRHLQGEADTSYDYAFRKFRTSTAVILPQRPVCVQCDGDYRDKRRAHQSKVATLLQPKIDRRKMPKPDVLVPGAISFLPLTLEQCEAAKAKREMLPGLRNGRSVRVREAWEITADNAKWTAKNNRKLAARGWIGYSPEAFDREILVSRGSVTAEAVEKFDRDLSRKGNKYRIQ
jgi:hypothetical protein